MIHLQYGCNVILSKVQLIDIKNELSLYLNIVPSICSKGAKEEHILNHIFKTTQVVFK